MITDKGEKIKADHVFWTVGSSPKIENNDLFMYAGFGDQLDVDSQRLKVRIDALMFTVYQCRDIVNIFTSHTCMACTCKDFLAQGLVLCYLHNAAEQWISSRFV